LKEHLDNSYRLVESKIDLALIRKLIMNTDLKHHSMMQSQLKSSNIQQQQSQTIDSSKFKEN
jgi:hypothetical protein